MKDRILLSGISIAFLLYGIFWITRMKAFGAAAAIALLITACMKTAADLRQKRCMKRPCAGKLSKGKH